MARGGSPSKSLGVIDAIPVIRFDDPTTTGGKVPATKARRHDNGKKLALHGERATCGTREGSWPMYGSVERMRSEGTPVVLQGHLVLYPRERNRVLAGVDVGCFYHRTNDTERRQTNSPISTPAQTTAYDEQFTLMDDAQRPLANVRCRIIVDGKVITGATNAQGKTGRISTPRASSLQPQIER
ncbi:PAAR domain-containing protein [Paraburkholderia dipogonis]|uniref:PAAR domain-containing protein n=1 Tax=Paraburkholderia dipogonis TaxID=1211383 RepID=A0A4Y8N7L3_9BURK|nr:PAAR domain-containing protein [Paraburkholderia dipogonis]TFE45695.1 PAAR domain-containing protein [Paraburkholderia dipogonis]